RSPLAADIAELPNNGVAESFLHLQVVIEEVRHTEILADRINAQALGVGCGAAIWIGASLYAWKNGIAPSLDGIPLVGNLADPIRAIRSEERRVGKEDREQARQNACYEGR